MRLRRSTSASPLQWNISLAVKLTVWADGFTTDITGRIHRVDPITHQLRVEVKPGEFEQVAFEDVVGVVVID
jgi:hypothetical protein